MRRNLVASMAVLGVALACGGCSTNHPVWLDDSQAVPATTEARQQVIHVHDLRKGDDLTATLQSGAVKHFRLVSFDGQALSGERLVLGIGGIERLEVRRNQVLYAAGKVTRMLGEFVVLGAVDTVAQEQSRNTRP